MAVGFLIASSAKPIVAIGYAFIALAFIATVPASARTPAEAYAKGSGGCHTSERAVI